MMVREQASEGETSVIIVGPRLLQEGLTALLEQRAGVRIAGTCRTGEALAMTSERSPDVVVMELPPQGDQALVELRALAKLRPPPRVIVVGDYCTRERITAALEAGVDACVSTEGGNEELVQGLDAVQRAQRFIGPFVSEILMRRREATGVGGETTGERGRLSTREGEVLALIAKGKTEREIAKQLGLSPKTVHTHRTSIMKKLGAHNVIGLVRRAIELGLVQV